VMKICGYIFVDVLIGLLLVSVAFGVVLNCKTNQDQKLLWAFEKELASRSASSLFMRMKKKMDLPERVNGFYVQQQGTSVVLEGCYGNYTYALEDGSH